MQNNISLYHAIKIENLALALSLNALRGYSTHRIHDNGTVPWCSDPKNPSKAYLDSKWYFGVCLTREKEFANQWNDVVIEFDKQALSARRKIVPYNWMETRLKAEFEEFVITGYAGFTCGEALIHSTDPDDEERYEQVSKNAKFLTDDSSYIGVIDRLDLMIKKISIQLGERPGQLGTLSQKAKMEMYEWRKAKFNKVERVVTDYCLKYGIELVLLND